MTTNARGRGAWWEDHRAELDSDAAPIHYYRLEKTLDEVLDPGTIVIGATSSRRSRASPARPLGSTRGHSAASGSGPVRARSQDGGHPEHVERPEELAHALERALESGEPAIVNVMLDPRRDGGHPYRGI